MSTLHADQAGRLWVGRWQGVGLEGDPVYDVFDADGRWLGAVHIPRELGAIVSIGEEFVVMRFIDELGVQYVTRTEYGRIKCGTYLAARRAAGLNPVTA